MFLSDSSLGPFLGRLIGVADVVNWNIAPMGPACLCKHDSSAYFGVERVNVQTIVVVMTSAADKPLSETYPLVLMEGFVLHK